MISDDLDEDADEFDDGELLTNVTTPHDPNVRNNGSGKPDTNGAPELHDWPMGDAHEGESVLDEGTLAWFRANNVDWHRGMEEVLRGWVTAQRQLDPPPEDRNSESRQTPV